MEDIGGKQSGEKKDMHATNYRNYLQTSIYANDTMGSTVHHNTTDRIQFYAPHHVGPRQ